MANRDAPHGFRPLRGPMRTESYALAAANSIIGVGDLVILTTAGTIDRAAASATQIVGVALEPAAASSSKTTIMVNDHPDTIYEAQVDASNGAGGTDVNALTAMGCNCDITVGDALNNQSIMELKLDTGAVTATLPIKTLRLYPSVDNAFGANNRIECTINNHVLKSTGVTGLA